MTWDESVINFIAARGYDPALGARPLGRVITEFIVNPLSEKLLTHDIQEGEVIEVKLEKDGKMIIGKV